MSEYEYINREGLLSKVENRIKDYGRDSNSRAPIIAGIYREVKTMIERIPTADVRPVLRGKWIKTPRTHLIPTGKMSTDEHGNIYAERKHETIFRLKCSCCGLTEEIETNFCPHCGAEMRQEVKE